MLTEITEFENTDVRDIAIVVVVFAAIYTIPKIGLKLLEKRRLKQIETYEEFTSHKNRYGRVYIASQKDEN